MAVLKRTQKVATLRVKEPVAALLISEERSIVPTVEGTEIVNLGVKEVTISLPRQMKNLQYQIKPAWKNTVDVNPQFKNFNIKNKTIDEFTLSWNSSTDSVNYQIEWQVHEVQ